MEDAVQIHRSVKPVSTGLVGDGVWPQSSGMNSDRRALNIIAPAMSRVVPNTVGKKSSPKVRQVNQTEDRSSSGPDASGWIRAAHAAKSNDASLFSSQMPAPGVPGGVSIMPTLRAQSMQYRRDRSWWTFTRAL